MQNIVILGGGTAGWMSANMLRHKLSSSKFSVTLIESATIGTIGVGEGSTPHLKQFFDLLDIDEAEWMPACNATFKNGISFIDWTENLNQNRYFHPFPSIVDRQTAGYFLQSCLLRHKNPKVNANPDYYFLAHELSKNGYGPKTLPNKPPLPMNYAYHFDSTLLGNFLSQLGLQKGVKHIESDFQQAHTDKNGNITQLVLNNNQVVKGDFFIDASGFNSLLLQKTLKVGFESFANNLFNDSAIALPSGISEQMHAETKATALKYGWAWHIPLAKRTGNGYVFSSQYTDFDTAESELRNHLKITDKSIQARHIKMKVGQVNQAWCKNVMAIGLAQGFIEPLEATALHLVMDSLKLFLQSFNNGEYDNSKINNFNLLLNQRYEGIRDYIVCHYKVNSRTDTQYWHDCRNISDLSDNLSAVLEAWHAGKEITPILSERGMTQYYPALSWYCLLAGYEYYKIPHTQNNIANKRDPNFERMRAYLQKTAMQFALHKTLIDS